MRLLIWFFIFLLQFNQVAPPIVTIRTNIETGQPGSHVMVIMTAQAEGLVSEVLLDSSWIDWEAMTIPPELPVPNGYWSIMGHIRPDAPVGPLNLTVTVVDGIGQRTSKTTTILIQWTVYLPGVEAYS